MSAPRRQSQEAVSRLGPEQYQRCRYWPHCEIHAGRRPETRRMQDDVGPGEREDIRAEFARGADRASIADRHRLTYDAVQKIIRGNYAPRSKEWRRNDRGYEQAPC